MGLEHQDISDHSLAVAHRIVTIEKSLTARLEDNEQADLTETLVRLRILLSRLSSQRPVAQQRFLERAV